jgi:DNA-binding NarL/FixJ family response regulator
MLREGGGRPVERSGSVVRVLVVDDQELFRHAIRAVVAETGRFEVVGHVDTGEAAAAAVHALRPDLVLMDVNLPGIDGLEATRRVQGEVPTPVVLLLSTYDADVGQGYADQSGAAGYLTKASLGPEVLEQAWEIATAPAEDR